MKVKKVIIQKNYHQITSHLMKIEQREYDEYPPITLSIQISEKSRSLAPYILHPE